MVNEPGDRITPPVCRVCKRPGEMYSTSVPFTQRDLGPIWACWADNMWCFAGADGKPRSEMLSPEERFDMVKRRRGRT